MDETMTRVEIDAMVSSRELDAIIARDLMELHQEESPDLGGGDHEAWYSKQGRKVHDWGPPPYSSSIAHAWQVCEKVFNLEDFCWAIEPCGNGTAFVTLCDKFPEHLVHESGDEPQPFPLEVCKAALKALSLIK